VTATIQEAQADLNGLLRRLAPGEELTLVDNGTEVATLRAKVPPPTTGKRVPGIWKGMATIISDDDDHLKDFAEYMS
jgi:antitoxin (DNA-binding transcriptional repressor) of toxin-antitoxin stability system